MKRKMCLIGALLIVFLSAGYIWSGTNDARYKALQYVLHCLEGIIPDEERLASVLYQPAMLLCKKYGFEDLMDDLLFTRAEEYAWLGKDEKALETYQKIIEEYPDATIYAGEHEEYGPPLRLKGDEKYREYLRKHLNLSAEKAILGIAKLYTTQNKYREAIQLLDDLFNKYFESGNLSEDTLAGVFEDLDPEQTSPSLESPELFGNRADKQALLRSGKYYFKLGELEKAMENFSKLIEYWPKTSELTTSVVRHYSGPSTHEDKIDKNPSGFGFWWPSEEIENIQANYVSAKIKLQPPKWNIQWTKKHPGIGKIIVYIGIDGYNPEDILPETVLLNDTVKVQSYGIERGLHARPKKHEKDFEEEVLQVMFNKFDSIQSLRCPNVGEEYDIIFSGELKDGKIFVGSDRVNILGKPQ